MELHTVNIQDLIVPDNRQRREFKPEELVKLADSISQNGLIQPVVVRANGENSYVLVAGERRIRAMAYIWNFGQTFRCGTTAYKEGEVPCLFQGEMDPIDAFEMELEENIRRTDLTWQESAMATSRLNTLRQKQAEKHLIPVPSIADISKEVRGESNTSVEATRKEILVARYLDDPEVSKAKSVEDAFKLLKRREETKRNADFAEEIGKTFSNKIHSLYQGDCLEVLPTIPSESFDIILTDPPYGIDADQYGDSGGRTPGAHAYKDDLETWVYLMRGFAPESFRLAKSQAHLYVFCDVDNFVTLKKIMADAGWKVFRTPIIWINPTAMRTPWPDQGPQRKYQIVLYGVKGSRPVTQIFPDVVTYPSDDNLGHEAQKPIAVYSDLLKRSIRPGNSVLDPFCGSGPIFPACHVLKCAATGVEMSASAYGIAAQRIEKL